MSVPQYIVKTLRLEPTRSELDFDLPMASLILEIKLIDEFIVVYYLDRQDEATTMNRSYTLRLVSIDQVYGSWIVKSKYVGMSNSFNCLFFLETL